MEGLNVTKVRLSPRKKHAVRVFMDVKAHCVFSICQVTRMVLICETVLSATHFSGDTCVVMDIRCALDLLTLLPCT